LLRGERNKSDKNERKGLLLLGIEPKSAPPAVTVLAVIRLYIRRIYTVGQNACTVIQIRNWWEIFINSTVRDVSYGDLGRPIR